MKYPSLIQANVILILLAIFVSAPIQQSRGSNYDDEPDVSDYGPKRGDWEMTLGGSGSSDKDIDVGNASIGGSIGYFLTKDWELSLRQGVIFADSGEGTDFWNGTTRAAVDYHFDIDAVQPFVGANFGGFYGDSITDTWAAGLEGGLKFYVKPETFIFVLGEYQWLFKDSAGAEDNFDNGRFLYSLGIGFNF
jgi:hypothetical protein